MTNISQLSPWVPAALDADAPPCQCHTSHASVAPMHRGHCCFMPTSRTCHAAEMAAWIVEHQRWHPGWSPS